MSNLKQSSQTREIKLRPIEFPKVQVVEKNDEPDELQEHLQTLTEQIKNAEDHLTQIDRDIENKRQALEKELMSARNKWEEEKVLLIEETKQSAFEQGFKDGEQTGFQSVAEKLIQADQIIEEAKSEQKKIINQSDAIILELATKIADKIVTYEIEENHAFQKMVEQAILEVHQQPSIQIFTSADDYQTVAEHRDQLMALLDPTVVLTIHPQEAMKKGDCVIKTPYSKLDVSVDLQLTKIKKRLIDVMEEIKRELD